MVGMIILSNNNKKDFNCHRFYPFRRIIQIESKCGHIHPDVISDWILNGARKNDLYSLKNTLYSSFINTFTVSLKNKFLLSHNFNEIFQSNANFFKIISFPYDDDVNNINIKNYKDKIYELFYINHNRGDQNLLEIQQIGNNLFIGKIVLSPFVCESRLSHLYKLLNKLKIRLSIDSKVNDFIDSDSFMIALKISLLNIIKELKFLASLIRFRSKESKPIYSLTVKYLKLRIDTDRAMSLLVEFLGGYIN